MSGFRMLQHNLLGFLKAFDGMDDLVVTVTEEGLVAAGTLEKAYFITRWTNYREGEECLVEGEIPLGQLKTFTSLISECGAGNEEVELQVSEDNMIQVIGSNAKFSMPTVNTASSQAGVSAVVAMIEESEASDWMAFGSANFGFHMAFDSSEFQQLRNTGKAIQSGALYCLEANVAGLTLSVKRDQIRMESTLEPQESSVADEDDITLNWFGKWLMDALKAMPGNGTIHLHGGNDSPLLIRHESPDGDFGTHTVIAPRQEEAEGSQ